MKHLLMILSIIFMVCVSGKVQAQTLTCSTPSGTLAFGTVNVLSGSPSYASTNVSISCNNPFGVAFTAYACLSIGSGSGGGTVANRLLASGASTIPIELRMNPSSPSQTGDGTSYPQQGPVTVNFTTSGASISFPVTGIIRPQGILPLPGTYTTNFSGTQFEIIGTATPSTTCAQVVATQGGVFTGTLSASAVIAAQCTVASTPMNFGTASIISSAITATAGVSVSCNTSTSFTVALDNGGYGTGPATRAMGSGPNRVTYGIYRDSARTMPWGNITGTNTVASSVTGASTATITAFGSVPPQAGAPPGSYADVVNVTVTY